MAGKKKDTVVEDVKVETPEAVEKQEIQHENTVADTPQPEPEKPEEKPAVEEEDKEDSPESPEEASLERFPVPEGFALVPLEPTRQQIMQGARFAGGSSRATYKVMIEQYLKDKGK